jgi:predicted acetyltransferase
MEKTKKTTRKKSSQKTKPHWSELLEKFNLITRDRTGFAIRDNQYGKMLEIRKTIHPKKSIVTPKGYALLREDEGNMFVKELIAFTEEEKSVLITQIKEKATKTVIAEAVLDSDLQTAYLSQGFMILENSFDVLMFKPLAEVSFAETYGKKFYAAATDYF